MRKWRLEDVCKFECFRIESGKSWKYVKGRLIKWGWFSRFVGFIIRGEDVFFLSMGWEFFMEFFRVFFEFVVFLVFLAFVKLII